MGSHEVRLAIRNLKTNANWRTESLSRLKIRLEEIRAEIKNREMISIDYELY